MNFDNLINDYENLINKKLKTVYKNGPKSLVEVFNYVINSDGKRVRPILTLLTNHVCKGNIENALPAALSIEMFHDFTLVHDDIMDDDKVRRGLKTVHEKWDLGTGVLTGDLILSVSLNNLIENYQNNSNVVKIFTKGLLAVCEGQALDKEFESKQKISITEYMKMIDLKTGYLLGMCTEIGAVTAEVNNYDARKLREYGILLGRGFQIQDDYLEIFSDSKKMGKSLQSDIMLNKKTFLMILANLKCPKLIQDAIELSKKDFNKGIDVVRKLLVEKGVKKETECKINEIFSEANKILNDLNFDTSFLHSYSMHILNRRR